MKLLANAIAILAILFTSLTVFALPQGNYHQTCRGCYMRHDKLFCECKTNEQIWQNTSLKRARGCDFIQNINGDLRCTNHDLPSGNYQRTCRNCRYNGMRLVCRCQDVNMLWRQTALNRAGQCKRNISNQDGHLVCGSHRHGHDLPAGSYRQTCHHCQFDGYRLACQCLNRAQFPNFTVLFNAANCDSIKNRNGFLVCKE